MSRPGVGSSYDDFAYVKDCEDDSSDRINTMLAEEASFAVPDYVTDVQQDGMEENWRRQIAKWCFQVADFYNYSRETASIAITVLDRFLTTTSVDKTDYQLASLCSLFIAVKHCEGTPPRMANFIMLAADRFLPENVITMEKNILDRIGWRINIPTPSSFVRAMLTYLNASQDTMQQIIQGVQYLIELASCEYCFITQRPSDIALGSILNILDHDSVSLPDEDRDAWLATLRNRFNLDESSEHVLQCQDRFQQLYDSVQAKASSNGNSSNANNGRQSPVSCEKDGSEEDSGRNPSPTGVDEDEVIPTCSTTENCQTPGSTYDELPSPNDRPRKRAKGSEISLSGSL